MYNLAQRLLEYKTKRPKITEVSLTCIIRRASQPNQTSRRAGLLIAASSKWSFKTGEHLVPL